MNLNDLATRVAENTKKQIADSKVETAAELKASVAAQVAEAMGASAKSLSEAITKDVLQRVPVGSVFSPDKGKSYDPELGLASMNAAQLKSLKDRTLFALTPDAVRAKMFPGADAKAMSVQVGADGGYTLPEEFIAEVARKLVKISVFRGNARVFSGVEMAGKMPRETGTVTVSYVPEMITPTATKFALGQITWNLQKRFALAQLTRELFKFSGIDTLGLLATMFAEQFQLFDDSVYMNGSGSGQPMGLRSQTTGMGSSAIAGSALDWRDLITLKHNVKSQYRLEKGSCTYIATNNVISKISQLRDDQNRPIFLDRGPAGMGGPDVPPQTVGFINGYPVMEDNYIPETLGAGGNASEIWFGNLKRGYFIFDGGVMETMSSDQAYDAFLNDSMYTRAISFDDGKPAIPEAMAVLTGVV